MCEKSLGVRRLFSPFSLHLFKNAFLIDYYLTVVEHAKEKTKPLNIRFSFRCFNKIWIFKFVIEMQSQLIILKHAINPNKNIFA